MKHLVILALLVVGFGWGASLVRTRDLPAAQAQLQPQRGPLRGGVLREPFRSVTDFGANGQDERWDSDAIQAAIDSLPNPTMPGTKAQCGGVVVLPQGRYLLNKPIRLRNGITLRGEGAGTVLYSAGDHPAILLYTQFEHHYISSAVVEDLSIVTEKSAGIVPDSTVTNIVQCRFENLIISAGGCAIDLNPNLEKRAYTQNTVIRNIHLWTPGGPALTLWGNANHIDQINTEGGTREGIQAEPAMVNVEGGWNDIRSCIIESNAPHPVVGFFVSGSFTWAHNWVEIKPARDNIAYIFKDVDIGQIDYLHEIVPIHRARFENCRTILIRSLDLDGELADLAQFLLLDESSHVRIDHITARMDPGGLDDPRISIGSIYNKTGNTRVRLPLREPAARLIAPEGAAPRGTPGRWQARWDTGQGTIRGSLRAEQEIPGAATRLRVEIAHNPQQRPLHVQTVLDVPDALKGKPAIITWRIDGPAQTVVLFNGKEIPSRAMNSKTANPLPAPLKDGDVLQFVFPPEPGVYFISEVELYAP